MNAQALIGKKINQTQGFLEDGTRVPLSVISVAGNTISQVKTQEHEGYNALQVGFGINKRPDKPSAGHSKKAGIENTPRFFREIRVDDVDGAQVNTNLIPSEIFELGDIVDVSGTSKGKGFAGVVKRYRFHGGPRTHGQSDRERARGSSGSGTTPGRVYKGKKMAGRMGDATATVKNLEILEIKDDQILVKGLVPGAKGSIVVITKVGKNKNFKPLWSDKVEEPEVETAEEIVETPEEKIETPQETVQTAEENVKTPEDTVQTDEQVAEPVTPEETQAEAPSEEVKEGEENAGK